MDKILPEIYSQLLPQELLQQKPVEAKATCAKCPQVPQTYNPYLKCCTFHPFLANYLVGGILKNNSPGAVAIKEKIKGREFALPIGLCAPTSYQSRFRNKTSDEFGNNFEFQCPFYRQGDLNCDVWDYRSSECTTFYCTSSYGQKGEEYWSQWREFLFHVEMVLSQELLIAEGYNHRDIESQLPYVKWKEDQGSIELTAVQWSSLWRHESDEIADFYIRCYERVKAVSSSEFVKLLNAKGLMNSIADSYVQLQKDLLSTEG